MEICKRRKLQKKEIVPCSFGNYLMGTVPRPKEFLPWKHGILGPLDSRKMYIETFFSEELVEGEKSYKITESLYFTMNKMWVGTIYIIHTSGKRPGSFYIQETSGCDHLWILVIQEYNVKNVKNA